MALERTVAPWRAPNAVWLPPPPNALAMSPPLPCCSRTTIRSRKQTRYVDGRDEVVEHNVLVYLAGPPASPAACQARAAWKLLTILAKPCGSRLAPPTRAPSMSGRAASAATLSGLTLPRRTGAETGHG